MKRHLRRIVFLALAVILVWTGGLLADSQLLHDELLRLHVVGASDSEEDQDVKLLVRDAVLASLEEGLADLTDPEQAIAYVQTMLPKVQTAANEALAAAGFSDVVSVSLTEEAFPTREYETFSLPAGIYRALRVVIGEGEGKNWWCVVFPQLCLEAAGEEAQAAANMEALPDSLEGAIEGEYEIRFWLLDRIGQVKNFLFGASE